MYNEHPVLFAMILFAKLPVYNKEQFYVFQSLNS
jgi:hypothetical protein